MAAMAQKVSSRLSTAEGVPLAGRLDAHNVQELVCGPGSPFSEVGPKLREALIGSSQQLISPARGMLYIPADPNAEDAWNLTRFRGDLMWWQLVELLRTTGRTGSLLEQGDRLAARMRHFPEDLTVLVKVNWVDGKGAHFIGGRPADKPIYDGTWFLVRE